MTETSAIIAVTKSHPESVEDLLSVRYEVAGDVALALAEAQKFRDIGSTVTVRSRFLRGEDSDPSRVIFQSIDDADFAPVLDLTFDDANMRLTERPENFLLLNLHDEYRVHWREVMGHRGRTVYPHVCAQQSPHFAPGATCSVCRGPDPARRVALTAVTLVIDADGVLRSLRLPGDLLTMAATIMERNADFSCVPVQAWREASFGRTRHSMEEMTPTRFYFDDVLERTNLDAAASRLPFLLSPVMNVVRYRRDDVSVSAVP